MLKFDECSMCRRITRDGLVCDRCWQRTWDREEDEREIAAMSQAGMVHAIGEHDARFLGLQLNSEVS